MTTVSEVYTTDRGVRMSRQGGVYTDRGVGMGHCQGGVYNRQRGRDGPLSGRCIQQTEGSGWATVREVYTQTEG